MKRMGQWIVAAAVIALSAQGAPQSAAADKELEAAMYSETVRGDLKGAAEQYRRIATRYVKQPDVAARALYQLGQCQEKLGQAEARKSYERVVKEYGSAGAYASAARARLAALGSGTSTGGSGPRLLWDNAAQQTWGVSADGRWVAFTDAVTRDLAIRDLLTGQERRVTNRGGLPASGADASLISRDGARIAYLWWAREEETTFRVIGADGKGERVLMPLPKGEWAQLMDWSADGRWVAARMGYAGTGWRIVLLSTEDGRIREIVSRESLRGGIPGQIRISPDGGWLAFGGPGADRSKGRGVWVASIAETRSPPVEVAAGAVLVGWNPQGNGLLWEQQKDGGWGLFQLPVANGRAAGPATKVPAPGVPGMHWILGMTSTGSLIYSTDSQTLEAVLLDADLSANRLGPIALSQTVANFGYGAVGGGGRWSPDGKRVLLTKTSRQVAIRSVEDGTESTIELPMRAVYRVEWAADSGSLLVGGEGRDGEAGLYRVNPRSGAATLIQKNEGWANSFAVFAATPDHQSVWVRSPQGISVVTLATGEVRRNVYPSPSFGLSDMRFSRDGKRLALLGDRGIDILDTATGSMQELVRTPGHYSGGDWSPDGQFLFSTWIPGNWDSDLPSELVKVPLSGGAPVRTALGASYVGLRLSPDGKRASVTRRLSRKSQVWVLERVLSAGSRR